MLTRSIFFALFNPKDPAHTKANLFTREYTGRVLTTPWVLIELADGWAKPSAWRNAFANLWVDLRANPHVAITPCSDRLLSDGVSLFSQRQDKEWSLTDCISFVVMMEEGLTDALTADRHFEQAGFVALLK